MTILWWVLSLNIVKTDGKGEGEGSYDINNRCPQQKKEGAMYLRSVMGGKLTKKFLMKIPDGLYLVSNLVDNKAKSIFIEKVSPLSEREAQWKRILSASVNQRKCHVFKTEEDYEKDYADFIKKYPNITQ